MSHFTTLVLVPGELGKKKILSPKKPKEEIFDVFMDLIYPYASYFPDTNYQVPCYCLPHEVMSSGVETANQEVGEFWELYQGFLDISEENRPEWVEYEPFKEWQRVCQKAIKQEPRYEERDPNCQYCDGSGFMTAKENFSRYEYDYFNIADLDPVLDPKLNPEFFIPVSELDSAEIEYEAIVTPDGRWHSIKWGGASDDPVADWEKRSQAILKDNDDHIAVKAHMHI